MKIALVSEYYYPLLGGITEHVYNLAKSLVGLGHEVTVITHNLGHRDDHHYPDEPVDFEVRRFGRGIPLYSNGSFARVTVGRRLGGDLQAFFEREKFDVIHAHSPLTPILPLVAVRRSNALATVGTFHTYFDRSSGYGLLRKKAARHMSMLDGRIVVSSACIEALSRYFDTDYRVIPNGVDPDYFTPDAPKLSQFDDGRLNILFLGRFDPRNGLGTMIEAFRLVRREFDGCRLIVVGDGPLRPWYQKKVGRELARDVHFAGLVNGGRPNYYSSADIYCSPCNKASFGVVLLEAMASGKPIVASDINGYAQVMRDGREGFMVPEGDVEAFAGKLLRLLRDSELRSVMGAEGRHTAVERFSWELVARQVEDYYLELLGEGRGAAAATDEPVEEGLVPAGVGRAAEEVFALNE
ncbi:MAG: glycosyltransferase family 4 protein [Pseudomonadota bacterium]